MNYPGPSYECVPHPEQHLYVTFFSENKTRHALVFILQTFVCQIKQGVFILRTGGGGTGKEVIHRFLRVVLNSWLKLF